MRKTTFIILTGLALTLLSSISLAEEKKKPAGPPPMLVTTAKIVSGKAAPSATFIGTIYFARTAEVAAEVEGIVSQVYGDDGRSVKFQIKVPDALAKYIAEKGSICVDGVSLTVNAVAAAVFDINVIPHTLNETIIGEYIVGQHVNIEVDIVARYLERLLLDDSVSSEAGSISSQSSQKITMELLKEHGFAK